MTDRNTDHFRGRHYYNADHISGPIAFLNPTTRLLPLQKEEAKPAEGHHSHHPAGPHGAAGDTSSVGNEKATPGVEGRRRQEEEGEGEGEEEEEEEDQEHHIHRPKTGAYHIWRSRDNRKGRHALALTPSAAVSASASASASASNSLPTTTGSSTHVHEPTDTLRATLAGVARMFLRYPVWDVSYDVAAVFTLGSVVWVLNGFFVLLPLTGPAGVTWAGESAWGGGITAMVGATVFEAGSVLLMLEAVNENRSECFGWALEGALGRGGGEEGGLVLRRDEKGCRHHHQERRSLLTGKSVGDVDYDDDDDDDDAKGFVEGDGEEGGASKSKGRRWTWWPSWYELRTHYFRDIGFLACLAQMIGSTIFWIAGITGLPQILGRLTVPATNGVYWLPQVVGGTGFIVSGLLFMLETQPNWYTPALTTLGWHIGFWNLLGAVGFTLCGALGFASSNEDCEYGLTWSTFIGSWAFLIGSIIQWYESLDKYPVAVGKVTGLKEKSQKLARKAED